MVEYAYSNNIMHSEFLTHCANGNIERVKHFIEEELVSPTIESNYAIGLASENGHLEIVRYLLSFSEVNPSDYDNYALYQASGNGHMDIVELLINDSRISFINPSSFESAYLNGHHDIVEILFGITDFRNSLEINNKFLYNKINKSYRNRKIYKFLKNNK